MKGIINTNIRYYPSQTNPYNPPSTLAVLVEGDIGDYACYVGHGDKEWVARNGNKISFEEAQCHFPIGLEKYKYRA